MGFRCVTDCVKETTKRDSVRWEIQAQCPFEIRSSRMYRNMVPLTRSVNIELRVHTVPSRRTHHPHELYADRETSPVVFFGDVDDHGSATVRLTTGKQGKSHTVLSSVTVRRSESGTVRPVGVCRSSSA